MPRFQLPMADLCTGCGRCCESMGMPPFEAANPDLGIQRTRTYGLSENQWDDALFDTELFLNMPQELRQEHALAILEMTSDPTGQPCYWYDTTEKRCQHYHWRPATCRRFRAGDTSCLVLRHNNDATLIWQFGVTTQLWQNPRSLLAQSNK